MQCIFSSRHHEKIFHCPENKYPGKLLEHSASSARDALPWFQERFMTASSSLVYQADMPGRMCFLNKLCIPTILYFFHACAGEAPGWRWPPGKRREWSLHYTSVSAWNQLRHCMAACLTRAAATLLGLGHFSLNSDLDFRPTGWL